MNDRDTYTRSLFPWFGGKRWVADIVWARFGKVKQYTEPFCGTAAMMFMNPTQPYLEVIGDMNFYVANFWRAVRAQPDAVAKEADYPVSHVDLTARHRWLCEPARTAALREALSDPEWPGDAKIAGWWVWGQSAWIGSGWCEREGAREQIPHITDAGQGIEAKIPHITNAGRGIEAKIPHIADAGQGEYIPPSEERLSAILRAFANRMRSVRVLHGSWDRCLNTHYGEFGGGIAAMFFDPPYLGFESLYSDGSSKPVGAQVAEWCKANKRPSLRIALCGHDGDYDLPGWEVVPWKRKRHVMGQRLSDEGQTIDRERIWFSPSCIKPESRQRTLCL